MTIVKKTEKCCSRRNVSLYPNTGAEIQKRLYECGKNYNGWIYETIEPFLGKRIVDVGCSIGNITQYFVNKSIVIGVDIVNTYLQAAIVNCSHIINFKTMNIDICSDQFLTLEKEKIDTIIFLNVLEHLKNDRKAIANSFKILTPGGRLIILVPAIKFLYGTMDISDKHYRRYSKKELFEKCKKTGFIIEKAFYQNFLGVFGWYINGRILKAPILPSRQLSLYDKFVPFLKRIEKIFQLPFGQSIFLIAKKI